MAFTRNRKNREITYDINDNGCWINTSHSKNDQGYGRYYIKGKHYALHRIMYERHIGKIPEGLCLLHSCDTPSCINPSHLRPGTHKENSQDMVNKGRSKIGTSNYHAKLSKEDVLSIRKERKCNYEKLGAKYGIGRQSAWNVLHYKTYKNIQ